MYRSIPTFTARTQGYQLQMTGSQTAGYQRTRAFKARLSIHTYIHTYSCLRLHGPGKKESRADFPFAYVWIWYETLPNALIWTGNRLGWLSCPANSNANNLMNSSGTVHRWQPIFMIQTHVPDFWTHKSVVYLRMHSELYLAACWELLLAVCCHEVSEIYL